jgi:hypothetical protein
LIAAVPPKDSAGTGTLTATLNTETNELTCRIEFSGLTGPAVAAHFHGPAAEGANAGPQLPIKGSPVTSPLTKPLSRQVELFDLLRGGSDLIIQSSKTQPILILRIGVVDRSAGLLQLRLAEFNNRAEPKLVTGLRQLQAQIRFL